MSPEPCRGTLYLKSLQNQILFLDCSFKFKKTKHTSDDKVLVRTIQTKPMKSLSSVLFTSVLSSRHYYLKAQNVQKMSTVSNCEIGELGQGNNGISNQKIQGQLS